MNNHGGNKANESSASDEVRQETPPFSVQEAEGSDLTPDELSELSRARDALAFLDRVRMDLDEFGNASRMASEPEAHISTLGDRETISDKSTVASTAIPECFGRFTIIETIGQGGFARVFRAHDPVLDREVALKIPRPQSLVSAESASRFRREAQAAAMLSHPAIVPVFESGTVGPISYIASEFCEGETLATWFKKQNRRIDAPTVASIVARLAEAVEHAHQRGVIHRDLKPANVLVEHSRQGKFDIADRIRITDFGLAKQMDSTGDSLTVEGAIVGTPAYMSPEQATGSRGTSAASDIYSLGVILFELLSAQLPFNKSNHLETLRAVESEPAPVLTRMDKTIPRDLSAICQKCLNKSPADRYATAFELANDLIAWRENRPVKARSVSMARRCRQWFVRNKALGSALTFAFTSLIIGLAVSLWQWNSAMANANRADAQLIKTTQANGQSEKRLVQIENFTRSLTGIFDDLNIENVRQSNQPLEAVLAERLVVVGKQLDSGMVDDQLVEADLKTKLAGSLIALGYASEAFELAESAAETRRELLGENDLLTAASLSCLGDVYRETGKYENALHLHERASNICTNLLGEDDRETLARMNQVAVDFQRLGRFQSAVDLFDFVLAKKSLLFGTEDPATLTSMNNLGSALWSLGKYAKAEEITKEALELREQVLGNNHVDTLASMDQLSRCLLSQKRSEQALPMLKETLRRRIEALGTTHPATLASMSSLASGYLAAGNSEEALDLCEQVLELRTVRLGKQHELTISSIHDLASIHYSMKNFELALPLFEQAHAALNEELGAGHPKALVSRQSLGAIHYQAKNYDRAFELLKESVKLTQAKLGLGHPDTTDALKKLANFFSNLGRFEESIEQHGLVVEGLTTQLGADDPQTLEAIANLGDCYYWAGNHAAAIEILEPVLKAGDRVPDYAYYRTALRGAYARAGQREKFQVMADEDLANYRETLEPESDKLRSKLGNLGLDYLYAEEYEIAESMLREAVAILEVLEDSGINQSRLANYQSLLGAAKVGQDDWDSAGLLLVQGYEGLVAHEASIHPKLRADTLIEAAERLTRFYEQTDRTAEAERIREELQRLHVKYGRPE